MLFFTALSNDAVDKFNDLLVYFVCLEDRVDHGLLRNFLRTGLDHDNFLSCGCNGKSKVRNFLLSSGRVDNELAVNKTYLGHCTRTVERNIGNACSNRGTEHSCELRAALRVNGHNNVVKCYVVSVVLRE